MDSGCRVRPGPGVSVRKSQPNRTTGTPNPVLQDVNRAKQFLYSCQQGLSEKGGDSRNSTS